MPKFKGTKTVEQIAKKHDVSVDFIKKQLDFGIKIEHEHSNQNKTARTIALQHLDEFPDYYSHLQSLENTAKTDNKLNRLENRILRNACNIINERVNPLKDPSTQLKKSSGAAALTPDAAKKLGPIAVKLQKAKASKVDLPKVTRLKESIRLPNKMGNLYNVSLNWRGKYIEVNVFFPQLRMPKKNEVQFEVRKIYPDARVITYIPADRYTSNTFIYVNEEVVDEALKKVGSKLSFTRLFRGTTKPRAELAKAGNTSMSDKGSLGSGHYVTHSQKKANQYSNINSKQRNEPAAKVTYRVPSKRIERVREIPKANELSDKPRELPKGKKVIVNKTSGHSVFPDPKDAQKYMVKNPQPIIRKPKTKLSKK
jgi:hypothetical protein